jgi:hypothetical protein
MALAEPKHGSNLTSPWPHTDPAHAELGLAPMRHLARVLADHGHNARPPAIAHEIYATSLVQARQYYRQNAGHVILPAIRTVGP